MKIVGWMPLKEHSTRLPGKNWRDLCGKPLFWHMLEAMLWQNSIYTSRLLLISEVFINTDNDTIEADYLGVAAPNCTVIKRKSKHKEATQSTVEMLVDDLDRMDADVIVYTHATIPLLRPETLQAAVRCFLDNYPRYDSVISVTRLHERIYDHLGRAVNFHPGILLPLQDMEPIFLENSAFFIMMADDLRRLHRRVGDRPYLFEIPANEAVEIDTEEDFQYAEWLYMRRQSSEADYRKYVLDEIESEPGANPDDERNYRQYVAECTFETVDLDKLHDAKINAGRIIE